jgi:leucine dehydrogenase
MTLRTTELHVSGYERVVRGEDPSAGYRAVIAIHSTALGPAVGGTRLTAYADEEAAVADALRLARGMTYKNALAGLPLGGGKSVVLRAEPLDRARVFAAHAEFVDRFAGRYVTAEDVGTTPADMALMAARTPHVAGLADRSGDPSPHTARGVFRAMEAAADALWGSASLAGRTVAVQGVGAVGGALARQLAAAGARLVVGDVNGDRAAATAADCGARVVPPERVLFEAADIAAPCALGGVLDEAAVPRLRARAVVGAANNQLATPAVAEALAAAGILYVPDYVANAGGVINGCRELLGWPAARSAAQIEALFETVGGLVARSRARGITLAAAADEVAERRLAAVRPSA